MLQYLKDIKTFLTLGVSYQGRNNTFSCLTLYEAFKEPLLSGNSNWQLKTELLCVISFPKGKQISFFCFVILFSLNIFCPSHLGGLQSSDFTLPYVHTKKPTAEINKIIQIGRDLWKLSSPAPLTARSASKSDLIFRALFDYLPRWRFHSISGQPVPVLGCPHHEMSFPLYRVGIVLVLVGLGPFVVHLWEGSAFSMPRHRVTEVSEQIAPASAFSGWDRKPWTPGMPSSSSPIIFTGLSQTGSSMPMSFLYWGSKRTQYSRCEWQGSLPQFVIIQLYSE